MPAQEKSVRIGITMERDAAPFWINEMLDAINTIASIELFVVNVTGVRKVKTNLFFRFFARIDHRVLPGKASSYSVAKHKLHSSIELNLKDDNKIDDADLEKLKALNLDVLLHLVDCPLDRSLFTVPKLGTYTLQFGNAKMTFDSIGFYEWFSREPVSSVRIVEANESSKFISEAFTKTDFLSLSRNQTTIFSSAIDLVVATLNRLSSAPESIQPREQKIISMREPNLIEVIFAFFKLGFRLAEKAWNKFFFIDQWILLTGDSRNFTSLELKNFKPIIPPSDRFWADPLVVSQDEKKFLFIEELPYQKKKGHLSCLVLDRDGKIEASKKVIETPYHLSYPFIFKHNNQWFLIPESAENKTVDLYECVLFPFEWKFKRTLLEGFRAYDSTLHFFNDRVWLFCTVQWSEGGSPNDNLYLFSADDLLEGKFISHPMNPVVSDPHRARPAGKIFFHEGSWYRPSQVCVPRYGYALAFNRMDELNEKAYRETVIEKKFPEEHALLKSMHTFNSDGAFTIIDGQIKRFRFFT